MLFRQLFDPETSTYTYLLADDATREAIVIDPVLDQLERDVGLIRELDLELRYALDTHVHADHVTALGSLRERLGARTVMSERAGVGCADLLVKDGDVIRFGSCGVEVRETPGHTSGCVSYVTLDHGMAFTGDALLIRGCGRTDFQGGDPEELYRSIHTRLFTLLYNTAKADVAITNNTFHIVFAPEIKEGLKLYENRILREVRAQGDFFREALTNFIERKKKIL